MQPIAYLLRIKNKLNNSKIYKSVVMTSKNVGADFAKCPKTFYF